MSPTPAPRLAALLLMLCGLGLPALAAADTWRVELIVFEDLHNRGGAAGEAIEAAVVPEMGDAIALDDSERLAAAGISLLDPEEHSSLTGHWQRLRNSARFRPTLHLVWLQRDPPERNGPRLYLRHGEPIEIDDPLAFEGYQLLSPLEGSIALTLQRFLHLDIDLQWADPVDYGAPVGFNLREQRRMRSDTIHHIDSPRFGVLARIVRAG